MNLSLKEFKSKNKPASNRQSKLDAYRDAILDLFSCGYSLEQMVAFLQANGVQTSKPNLSKFIKKHSHSDNDMQIADDASLAAVTCTQPLVESQPKKLDVQSTSSIGKFDWKKKIDINELI